MIMITFEGGLCFAILMVSGQSPTNPRQFWGLNTASLKCPQNWKKHQGFEDWVVPTLLHSLSHLASNSRNVADVHPDKLIKESGKLTTAELLPRDKDVKLQRLPRSFGISSNMFNQGYIDELRLFLMKTEKNCQMKNVDA
ncbi:hypothetical protein OSB04_010128 [Centaurea solstitialis]|uniref:Uncharacterized protein n=1 Tax=Centaurea solstitialis TaxID=347529 RepID=A0AA38WMT8_9ASTR|nr:hypothetical protein OSB04_010128 [Centaurea solstitialis]